MDSLGIMFWEIMLNVTGVCLWGITMIYLIRNKISSNRDKPGKGKNEHIRKFEEEIFVQLVKQQSERAFRRISNTIRNEKQILGELIEKGELKKARNHLAGQKAPKQKKELIQTTKKVSIRKPKEESIQKSKKKALAPKSKVDNKYVEVVRLVDIGMSAAKISEKMQIPKGEINLIVKLRKKRNKVAEKRTRRTQVLA